MTYMANRTYFDPQSGCIMDLPPKMLTKRGEEVRLKAKAASVELKNHFGWNASPAVSASVESTPEDEHAPHRYGEKWNRPGEFAAYRERVEAQFSAPVKRNGDAERAVSIVISGFPASGKSTIGRIIARALMQSGIKVRTQGQRATLGIAGKSAETAEIERIRLSPATEPVEVELWEIDRAAPHNH